jgi:hypothetical protein
MEKIPTAEEFLIEKGIANPLGELWRLNVTRDCYAGTEKEIQQAMKEFAKLHVEAALKQASKSARLKELEVHLSDGSVDEYSILNSYSLDKIK